MFVVEVVLLDRSLALDNLLPPAFYLLRREADSIVCDELGTLWSATSLRVGLALALGLVVGGGFLFWW